MKQSLFVLLMLGTVILASVTTAEARYYRRGYGYGSGGAQTAQSAEANAMANVIRAQGSYNVATSRAMINVERARGNYLANQKKAMELYYSRRRAVQARHAEELVEERAKIQRYQEFTAQARLNAPKLSSNQLNPSTGQITWPRALQGPAFAEHRTAAEAFFAARVKQSDSTGDTKKMHDTITAIRDELRGHIHDMVTNDYVESRKFLELLMSEVDHARG